MIYYNWAALSGIEVTSSTKRAGFAHFQTQGRTASQTLRLKLSRKHTTQPIILTWERKEEKKIEIRVVECWPPLRVVTEHFYCHPERRIQQGQLCLLHAWLSFERVKPHNLRDIWWRERGKNDSEQKARPKKHEISQNAKFDEIKTGERIYTQLI